MNVFLQKHGASENVSSTATILIVDFFRPETNDVQVCDLVSSVLHNFLNAMQVHFAFSVRISNGKKKNLHLSPLEYCCQYSCNELAKDLYLYLRVVSGLRLNTVLVQKNVVHLFQVSDDISGFLCMSNILYILNLFCHPYKFCEMGKKIL